MSQTSGLFQKAKATMQCIKSFTERFAGFKEPSPSDSHAITLTGDDSLTIAISHHLHDDLGTWTHVSVDRRGAILRKTHFEEKGGTLHYHGSDHSPDISRVDEPLVHATMEEVQALEEEHHREEERLDADWELVKA